MPEIKLVYQQIKHYIENELENKKPGEFLNSEVQYSLLFNVSRPTVRKAVDELVLSGLVKRIPGKGLAVADPKNRPAQGNLLFLIPYIPDDGFFYNMVMGCIDAANKCNFSYKVLNHSTPLKRPNYMDYTEKINLDDYSAAVLTVYDNDSDYKLLNLMEKKNFPYVLVDNPIESLDCHYVITDDCRGGYLSGEYLVKKGHTKILYITRKGSIYTVRTREKGFRKALSDYNVSISDKNFIYLKNDEDILKLLPDLKFNYTAICGYSDLPVILAYNTLADMGIKVPEQVSLMGYGNFIYSQMLKVPLTTISMPVYDMGYKAVEMAVNMVKGIPLVEKRMVLDVDIIERNSVAFTL